MPRPAHRQELYGARPPDEDPMGIRLCPSCDEDPMYHMEWCPTRLDAVRAAFREAREKTA